MKALLIQPPIHDFYISPDRLSALGLLSLVPLLEEKGWDWEFINFPYEYRNGKALPLPPELADLKPFLIQGETGPVSWFRRYARFGPDTNEALERIVSAAPDLLLISCFAWAYAEEALELVISAKKALPTIPIVIGGHGASVMPAYFTGKGKADVVFTGEAEGGFSALLGSIEKEPVPGSSTNTVISAASSPEEQNLHPVWSGRKVKTGYRYAIMLSRGCPRKCRFCSNHLVHGRQFRKVLLKNVLKSIRHLPTRGRLTVNFEDDNLLLAPQYFLTILGALKSHNPDFGFTAENGFDYTLLNYKLLEQLKSSGLEQLNISLAVSRPELAGSQTRFINLTHFESVLKAAEELNIPVITYFICGLEGDTAEGIVETLLYLVPLKTRIGISPFYPVPGLEGLESFNFEELPPGLCRGSSVRSWMESLSTAQLITAFRLTRIANLLKSEPEGLELEIINRSLATKRVHTLVRKDSKKELIPIPNLDIPMMEKFLTSVASSMIAYNS